MKKIDFYDYVFDFIYNFKCVWENGKSLSHGTEMKTFCKLIFFANEELIFVEKKHFSHFFSVKVKKKLILFQEQVKIKIYEKTAKIRTFLRTLALHFYKANSKR